MKISLIISFYKRLDFLELILAALPEQQFKNFEVVVAEDDNEPATRKFLESQARRLPFKILHVFQHADAGFRKNEMLNKAITIARGELLIVIDGDCILHRAFFKEYEKAAAPGIILFGRRALLSPSMTHQLLASKKLSRLNILRLLWSKSSRVEDVFYLPGIAQWLGRKRTRGVQGSNMGFFKDDIVAINGFDEDYQKATAGEDDDIEWRFRAGGYQFKSMKFKALQYHLYHPSNYSGSESRHNLAIMQKKMQEGKVYCLNGIDKYSNGPMIEFLEY